MEVIDKFGPLGFECHRCGGLLEGEDHSSGDLGGHEKQSTLMNQLDSLLKMLQQVDSEVIPNNDFDTAFTHAKPVQRDEASNPIRPSVPLSNQKIPPAAVKGVMQVTAGPLDVSVTTSSESTAAEQAAEAQRNADIAAQNVLPVWHTTSTVTGESTVKSKRYSEQQNHGSALPKDVGDVKNSTNVLNDELAAYYAQMLQEKDKEAREDQEGEDSSGDDEDDFEDVDIGGSAIGTPSSSMSAEPSGPRSRQLNGSLKRKESESGSSAPATNTSTPAPSAPATNEGPVAKKVKFENLENGGPIAEPAAGDRADKDSDEDEEAEFEDAL